MPKMLLIAGINASGRGRHIHERRLSSADAFASLSISEADFS
jgi:hypothetical protein